MEEAPHIFFMQALFKGISKKLITINLSSDLSFCQLELPTTFWTAAVSFLFCLMKAIKENFLKGVLVADAVFYYI